MRRIIWRLHCSLCCCACISACMHASVPCTWGSCPAECSSLLDHGGWSLCLRGTSCHRQSPGRMIADTSAAPVACKFQTYVILMVHIAMLEMLEWAESVRFALISLKLKHRLTLTPITYAWTDMWYMYRSIIILEICLLFVLSHKPIQQISLVHKLQNQHFLIIIGVKGNMQH